MDSKEYRKELGFSNKTTLQTYFKAKDIKQPNWPKIALCNDRLREIFTKLNNVVSDDIKLENIEEFCKKIDFAFSIMKENGIIEKLNNQGREPDDVYYNWMRGYLVCEYFMPAIAKILEIKENSIRHIGKDDLTNIKTFTRSATADLEILVSAVKKIRLEIQAGYTGVNDIKQSKILEAKRIYDSEKTESYIVHFDLFNGLAAIINITNFHRIPETSYHKAFENTNVLSIKDEWFRWKLTENLNTFKDLEIKSI